MKHKKPFINKLMLSAFLYEPKEWMLSRADLKYLKVLVRKILRKIYGLFNVSEEYSHQSGAVSRQRSS